MSISCRCRYIHYKYIQSLACAIGQVDMVEHNVFYPNQREIKQILTFYSLLLTTNYSFVCTPVDVCVCCEFSVILIEAFLSQHTLRPPSVNSLFRCFECFSKNFTHTQKYKFFFSFCAFSAHIYSDWCMWYVRTAIGNISASNIIWTFAIQLQQQHVLVHVCLRR